MKKVTAKHLMIGDWVKWKGEYRKVVGLWLNYDRDSLIDLNSVISTSTATPIPITEEWLKLNGFDTDDIYFVKMINKDIVISMNIDGHLCMYIHKKANFLYDIKYIHQLQQAYRLATGKELKIKF